MELESGTLSKISLHTAKSITAKLRTTYLEDKAVFTIESFKSRLGLLLQRHDVTSFSMVVSHEDAGYVKAVINLFTTELVFRLFYNQYNVLGVSAALIKTEIL